MSAATEIAALESRILMLEMVLSMLGFVSLANPTSGGIAGLNLVKLDAATGELPNLGRAVLAYNAAAGSYTVADGPLDNDAGSVQFINGSNQPHVISIPGGIYDGDGSTPRSTITFDPRAGASITLAPMDGTSDPANDAKFYVVASNNVTVS